MEKMSISVKIKCILFFFIILFPSYIHAGETGGETAQTSTETQKPVTVTSSLSPAEAFLGDVITYTITIYKTPGTLVNMPEINEKIEGLSFIKKESKPESKKGNRIEETASYTFQVDKPEDIIFSPIPISYEIGREIKEISTKEITLKVTSILPQNTKDILDITPLEKPGFNTKIL